MKGDTYIGVAPVISPERVRRLRRLAVSVLASETPLRELDYALLCEAQTWAIASADLIARGQGAGTA